MLAVLHLSSCGDDILQTLIVCAKSLAKLIFKVFSITEQFFCYQVWILIFVLKINILNMYILYVLESDLGLPDGLGGRESEKGRTKNVYFLRISKKKVL